MPHRKYEKVERWDHEEIEGINKGVVHIQEKIDGANGQVFYEEDCIYVGSRTRILAKYNIKKNNAEIIDEFRGFPKYVFQNENIKKFFIKYPTYRLYGEWLVKHIVIYEPNYLSRFWIFDIFDDESNRFLTYEEWEPIVKSLNLDFIPVIKILTNPTMKELLDMVKIDSKMPNSGFGAQRIEGLVYKNFDFVNKFGKSPYMKAVTKEFLEIHHAIMGSNRFDPPEVYIADKYIAIPRMRKIFEKMKETKTKIEMKDIPEFMERVYHDLLQEDSWSMFGRDKKLKNLKIDFRQLRKVVGNKAKNFFISTLREEIMKN